MLSKGVNEILQPLSIISYNCQGRTGSSHQRWLVKQTGPISSSVTI